MMWVAGIIVLAIAAGPPMAMIRSEVARRFIGWMLLAGFVAATHFMLCEDTGVMRMFGICCVLLASMKGLVYAEWARTEKLSLAHYLVFATCWFGMDPASFRKRRAGLSVKEDVGVGLTLMSVGLLGCWLVWMMGWFSIWAMFIPMSLAFHFGVLRLMKAAHRMAGYPVRTLFPNVLVARGIGDFWSRRWNVGYSQMMQRLVGRPVSNVFGNAAGIMAVFVGSGILHELAITLPVGSGYGLPTLYFTFHGLLVLAESRSAKPIGRVPSLLLVALPIGLLFPPAFQYGVIFEILSWFGGGLG